MDLLEAKRLLETGRTTPLALLEEALERAKAFQDRNALAYLDEEAARKEALALTEELRRGQVRGPLHGLPLTCLLYTSPSPRDGLLSRMPSSA